MKLTMPYVIESIQILQILTLVANNSVYIILFWLFRLNYLRTKTMVYRQRVTWKREPAAQIFK